MKKTIQIFIALADYSPAGKALGCTQISWWKSPIQQGNVFCSTKADAEWIWAGPAPGVTPQMRRGKTQLKCQEQDEKLKISEQ